MKKEYAIPIGLLILGFILSLVSARVAMGTDGTLFARSGSILCLLATVAQFNLSTVKRTKMGTVLTSHDLTREQKLEMLQHNPPGYRALFTISLVAGLLGTLVWGYGDLLY